MVLLTLDDLQRTIELLFCPKNLSHRAILEITHRWRNPSPLNQQEETIEMLESIGEDDVLKLNSKKLIEIVDASTKKYPRSTPLTT